MQISSSKSCLHPLPHARQYLRGFWTIPIGLPQIGEHPWPSRCPMHSDLEHVISPLWTSVSPICLWGSRQASGSLQAGSWHLLDILPSQYSTRASEMLGFLSLSPNYRLRRVGAPTLKTLPRAFPTTTLVSPHR